jgi:hypothetical protein
MIDAQAVEQAGGNPVEHQAVRVLEHLLVFHPQADQRVDVEEAAVAKVTAGAAPPRQAIALRLQQIVQLLAIPVQLLDRRIERCARAVLLGDDALEQVAQHDAVAVPAPHAAAVGSGWARQCGERIGNEGQPLGT